MIIATICLNCHEYATGACKGKDASHDQCVDYKRKEGQEMASSKVEEAVLVAGIILLIILY